MGNYLRAEILWLSKINPFRKVKNLTNNELEIIFNNSKILTWGKSSLKGLQPSASGIYDKEIAIKLKIINKSTKMASDYNRLFFIYMEEEDIYGNKVVKKELYDGSQKRFISYILAIQK